MKLPLYCIKVAAATAAISDQCTIEKIPRVCMKLTKCIGQGSIYMPHILTGHWQKMGILNKNKWF